MTRGRVNHFGTIRRVFRVLRTLAFEEATSVEWRWARDTRSVALGLAVEWGSHGDVYVDVHLLVGRLTFSWEHRK